MGCVGDDVMMDDGDADDVDDDDNDDDKRVGDKARTRLVHTGCGLCSL